MFFYTNEGEEFICLTYADEVNLAKSVMDCIALRWVQGEFQALLDRIYYVKCVHGSYLKLEELYRLLYFMGDRYYDELSSLGIKCPDIEDNDDAIWSNLDEKQYPDRESRSLEARRMTILAWREVWDNHAAHKMVADKYKRFPGDEWREDYDYDQTTMDAVQERLEKAFWEEVNKTCEMYAKDGYDVPRYMIIKQVEDYMPRKITDVEVE